MPLPEDSPTPASGEPAAAAELASLGVARWQHDPATGRVQADAEAWGWLGLAPDACGRPLGTLLALIHPQDRSAAIARWQSGSTGPLELTARVQHADGSWRLLLSRGHARPRPDGQASGQAANPAANPVAAPLAGHAGVVLHLSAQAEDRLREAHERSALATRGAGIGTWESDTQADAGWWDAQMFALRGLSRPPGLVQRSDMLQWLHPEDIAHFEQHLRSALDQDGPTDMAFRIVRPDGQCRWLASRSVPVRDARGRTVRRIGINWDITDTREAAQARQEHQAALRESQAKSRLLARISHELRTPLNSVLGFSQLLLAEGPDPATWRQRLTHVHTAGQHLLDLIDDVLELSSLDSGELPQRVQPVALQALLDDCLPQVQLLAQAHGVDLALAAPDGWVLADAARLRQALLNLLSNAIHYNHPGGRVTLDGWPEAGHWALRLQDTGVGMDAQQLALLFEPFNRLGQEQRGRGGVGLGLAIARAAIRQMGGDLRVRSHPGQGTCFELRLQRATAPPALSTLAPLAPVAVSMAVRLSGLAPGLRLPLAAGTDPGTVLYIEDNEVNLMIVEALMNLRPDLRLVSALDGQRGLDLARQVRPHLVLLDMQLPDIDGLAVLKQLRADPATADIPCIVLSANAQPEDIQVALAAGFDAYWTKPLNLAEFQRALERMFGPGPAKQPGADAGPRPLAG